ncbi:hypothetical protein C8R44DRAFT_730344 [Mycena epipterygia]|nr:hypothetical protein C8R44DRAFT_730344 [Mycena epipterygia]
MNQPNAHSPLSDTAQNGIMLSPGLPVPAPPPTNYFTSLTTFQRKICNSSALPIETRVPNDPAAIPELEESELAPDYYDGAGYECKEEYTLDLSSGLAESACPTPTPSLIKRRSHPPSPSTSNLRRRSTQRDREAERDCGICFEPASSPVRTLCCAHLFCAEHIAQWLLGPDADARCPACRAACSFAFGEDASCSLSVGGVEKKGLLALGHPALLHIGPRTPPPSRSASPSPSYPPSSSSVGSSSSYPTSPSSCSSVDPATSEPEEADATDYSLPARLHACALQTRRHTAHPFFSVLGVKAATVRVLCIAAWVVVVAALAPRWSRLDAESGLH